MQQKETIGENIQIEIKDGKAILTIDLEHRGNVSASGKSVIVATTRGNVPIPGSTVVRDARVFCSVRSTKLS